MSAGVPVILEIRLQGPPQGGFIEHQDVVQALPPDRSNQPFHVWILPGRSRGRQDLPDGHPSHPLAKRTSIDRVAIMEQIAWGRVPGKGLSNLLCGPFGGGISSDVEMNQAAPMMSENHKDK